MSKEIANSPGFNIILNDKDGKNKKPPPSIKFKISYSEHLSGTDTENKSKIASMFFKEVFGKIPSLESKFKNYKLSNSDWQVSYLKPVLEQLANNMSDKDFKAYGLLDGDSNPECLKVWKDKLESVISLIK